MGTDWRRMILCVATFAGLDCRAAAAGDERSWVRVGARGDVLRAAIGRMVATLRPVSAFRTET